MSCSLSGGRFGAAVNIGRMMERLGIDPAYGVLPSYGVIFSSAWRTCRRCAASAECTKWLAETRASAVGPPRFCPNADLLWELLCDPAVGHCSRPAWCTEPSIAAQQVD